MARAHTCMVLLRRATAPVRRFCGHVYRPGV